MAQNQSNQKPASSSCEKIRKSTFGRFRRVSNVPKNNNIPNPSLSAKNRVSYTQPMALHQPVLVREIPIVEAPSPVVKSIKNIMRFSSKNVKKGGDGGGKELTGQKTFGEEKFDSFIGRMKMKMNAPSDIGGGRTITKHDSFNENISNFIDRAKLKLRATSSMGANGKPVSFK